MVWACQSSCTWGGTCSHMNSHSSHWTDTHHQHTPTAPSTRPLHPAHAHCTQHTPTAPSTRPLHPAHAHCIQHTPTAPSTRPLHPAHAHCTQHTPTVPSTRPLHPAHAHCAQTRIPCGPVGAVLCSECRPRGGSLPPGGPPAATHRQRQGMQ